MIEKQYTIEEHRAFLAALAEVDMDLPVAQNPNESCIQKMKYGKF